MEKSAAVAADMVFQATDIIRRLRTTPPRPRTPCPRRLSCGAKTGTPHSARTPHLPSSPFQAADALTLSPIVTDAA